MARLYIGFLIKVLVLSEPYWFIVGVSRLTRRGLFVLPQFGLTPRLVVFLPLSLLEGTRAAARLPQAVIDLCFEEIQVVLHTRKDSANPFPPFSCAFTVVSVVPLLKPLLTAKW
jgi:hypothetical protein